VCVENFHARERGDNLIWVQAKTRSLEVTKRNALRWRKHLPAWC
jgi:hypothetical protein